LARFVNVLMESLSVVGPNLLYAKAEVASFLKTICRYAGNFRRLV
jgi:hypothetical protein